jgi:hypothetical protein
LRFAKIATGACGSQKKEPAADAVRKIVGQDWVYGAYRVCQILPEDAAEILPRARTEVYSMLQARQTQAPKMLVKDEPSWTTAASEMVREEG